MPTTREGESLDVRGNGVWRYVYRSVDQYGQVVDVLVYLRRGAAATRRFFERALRTPKVTPVEVVTDAAPVYPAGHDDLVPSAWHRVERYANRALGFANSEAPMGGN
jgi:transposase-like protein